MTWQLDPAQSWEQKVRLRWVESVWSAQFPRGESRWPTAAEFRPNPGPSGLSHSRAMAPPIPADKKLGTLQKSVPKAPPLRHVF